MIEAMRPKLELAEPQARLRQFWLRCLLFSGLVLGLMPLLTLPFITQGSDDSPFDVFTVIFYSLTILPASALAFWHRRVACWWLGLNAILVISSTAESYTRTHQLRFASIMGTGIAFSLALFLGVADFQHWPDTFVSKREFNS